MKGGDSMNKKPKTPARGTFVMGEKGPMKEALGGTIKRGKDLRGNSVSNKGKMKGSYSS
uniref:Uncharacterized protein n=2 Tax=viral metagenome TaxID=1070528 RepID=A0A6H2A0E5_9ZZZZ